MKVLISGSHGFIGTHLGKYLKRQEFEVVIVPRQFLYDYPLLSQWVKQQNPDWIFHLASYGNMSYQTEDVLTIKANIETLTNLLSATNPLPYTGFINFSSSSVGIGYETVYSATKAAGEHIARAMVNKYKKPIVSVRPFTVIGPGEQETHLIPKLIESCQKGIDIPFDGPPVHDYIGIEDFCEAIMRIIEHIDLVVGQIIDIGTGIQTSNESILQIVESLIGKKATVHRTDNIRPYDTKQWKANPEIIKKLGWNQKQTVEDVIKTML